MLKKVNDRRRSVLVYKYLFVLLFDHVMVSYSMVQLHQNRSPCKVISGAVILKIDIKMNICVPLLQAKFSFIVSSRSSRSLYSSFLIFRMHLSMTVANCIIHFLKTSQEIVIVL